MSHASVPLDTPQEVYDVLVGRWRAMSIAERVGLVDQICADVEEMARAGINSVAPDLTEAEVRRELARRRFGDALADEAFPPAAP